VATAAIAAPWVAVGALGAGSSGDPQTYIVELRAAPAAVAPAPVAGALAPGGRSQSVGAAADAARARIDALERLALARLAGISGAGGRGAGPPVLYRYRDALAGFAARLTAAQAVTLAAAPEVAQVTPDRLLTPAATTPVAGATGRSGGEGPAFLGLPEGLWARLGGPGEAGRGQIVGVVDTGIAPTSPSFAATGSGGGAAIPVPAGWRGICQTGDGFPPESCSGKLVGARAFAAGYGADLLAPGEHISPLDGEGHGTHTAATAAGDAGVLPDVGGSDLGVPALSGVAPAASVAAYKACWSGRKDPGWARADGCAQSDVVAAIDAAVADGVDVLNYSVGGAPEGPLDPVSMALMGAAASGVFVSAAAGNDGPAPGTVRGPPAAPWVTAVGASTLARSFSAAVRLRDAGGVVPDQLTVIGASVSGPLAEAPILDASRAALPGVAPGDAGLCLPGSLDPARAGGAVVLCGRGVNAGVQKALAVRSAGGVGMIVANSDPGQELSAEAGWVPSLSVGVEDGASLRAVIAAAAQPLATVHAGTAVPAPGDVLAQFSARGPQATTPDVAKPDLVAPGVAILAASAAGVSGETPTPPLAFQALTGTSMAAPQVAGAAALLMQLHPGWSPAVIRSALMTTANPAVVREDGETPATPWDVGSGRIDPTRAADPGLVLDVSTDEYVRFLEAIAPGTAIGRFGRTLAPLRPLDLNLPSIAISRLGAGEATARTLTSVDGVAQTWTVVVQGVPGVAASASTATIALAPGASTTLALSFAPAGLAPGQPTFGAVVLTDVADGRTVRIPVSIVG
jgi:subtilisin family serine protease